MPTLSGVTLVLGGASSGKSDHAEVLARHHSGPRTYIATAQSFDAEMTARIAAHRTARANDGWLTVEAPLDVAAALRAAQGLVLLDCLTLWLSNVILAERDVGTDVAALIAAFRAPMIVVSNEVGQGIVPDNALARRFRSEQGRLNRAVAARADVVVGVMAGLPFALKGSPP